LTVYDLFIWIYRLFFRREIYLQGRLKVMQRELREQWPYNDPCLSHINEEENEHLMKGKIDNRKSLMLVIDNLVRSRDESVTTGDQIYVLADGRKIHHQSRMYLVPRIYYKNNRTIFHFFNLEYLEADGHFILRIIGTNSRYEIQSINESRFLF
jgi:hypothetical protein